MNSERIAAPWKTVYRAPLNNSRTKSWHAALKKHVVESLQARQPFAAAVIGDAQEGDAAPTKKTQNGRCRSISLVYIVTNDAIPIIERKSPEVGAMSGVAPTRRPTLSRSNGPVERPRLGAQEAMSTGDATRFTQPAKSGPDTRFGAMRSSRLSRPAAAGSRSSC